DLGVRRQHAADRRGAADRKALDRLAAEPREADRLEGVVDPETAGQNADRLDRGAASRWRTRRDCGSALDNPAGESMGLGLNACSAARSRGYEQSDLIDGVEVTGASKMHELIKAGAATLSF